MSRQVSVKVENLKDALSQLGFNAQNNSAGHTIFSHAKTGAVVSVPTEKSKVPAIYVSTAARQIVNSGIATAEKFEAALKRGGKRKLQRSYKRTESLLIE